MDRVPPVGLPVDSSVAGDEVVVENERRSGPSHAHEMRVADDIHVGALGTQPGNRRFREREGGDDTEVVGLEYHEFGRAETIELGPLGSDAAEVLRDQVPVGQDHEAVVRALPRKFGRGQNAEIVGAEPMRVPAEHDVERTVGVNGDTSGPHGVGGEIR